jgi:hypothetical protein
MRAHAIARLRELARGIDDLVERNGRHRGPGPVSAHADGAG